MEDLSSVWLFPGQGSQFVGMGWELLREFHPAAETLEIASDLCGADLKHLCLHGPEAELTRTDRLQPAILAIALGCCQLLRRNGYRPDAVAGHSLGEFAALYAAGVLTLEDSLRLVSERGRLMHEGSQHLQAGMLAVRDLGAQQVEALVAELQDRFVISVANYNGPLQTVLTGEREALAQAQSAAQRRGATVVPLNVSGPWHSPLLREAEAQFAACIEGIEFRDAALPVFLNVTGARHQDGAEIQQLMRRQMCSPVRWNALMQEMLQAGAQEFVEVGPGKVLRGLLRGIQPDADAYVAVGIDGPRALKFLRRASSGLAA
jgi:[acyl-carrier-protein] S-malonyltransferase